MENGDADLDMDFSEFMELMRQTTANLRKMNEAQSYMRWQFGESEEYDKFVQELNTATDGWVSSHC